MRGLPMIRSLRAAVMFSLLMLLPLFLLRSDPVSSTYGIILCAMLAPALLPMTALWGGLLPAALGLVSAVLMAWLPFGQQAGLLMMLFLAPPAIAFFVCVARRIPFFHTATVLAAAEMLGGFAVLFILNRQADGELARSLAERFGQMIRDSGMQDEWLLVMMQSGLARLDPSLYSQATGLLGGLSAMGREELMLSLVSNLTDILGLLPALLVVYSIWHSLAGLGMGIYFGRRAIIRQVVDTRRRDVMQRLIEQRRTRLEQGLPPEAPEGVRLEGREKMLSDLSHDCEAALDGFPTLLMPPFSLWHLPRKIGLMAALPGLGYVLAAVSPQAQLVGNMLGGVFSTLYTIQGIAALDFVMGRAGRRLGVRMFLLGVIGMLFSRVFLFVGILDQIANFRKLRPPLGASMREDGKL